MKAAVLFESPGALSIEDLRVDGPGPSEVLLRVAATGLCHSDLHYLDRHYPLEGPTVMGHEGAGVVEAVGSDVTYVKPGDHVISFPVAFCGQCEFCLAGRPTLCGQEGLRRAPAEGHGSGSPTGTRASNSWAWPPSPSRCSSTSGPW